MGQRAKVGQRSNCRFLSHLGDIYIKLLITALPSVMCCTEIFSAIATLGLPYMVSMMSSMACQYIIMKVCMVAGDEEIYIH